MVPHFPHLDPSFILRCAAIRTLNSPPSSPQPTSGVLQDSLLYSATSMVSQVPQPELNLDDDSGFQDDSSELYFSARSQASDTEHTENTECTQYYSVADMTVSRMEIEDASWKKMADKTNSNNTCTPTGSGSGGADLEFEALSDDGSEQILRRGVTLPLLDSLPMVPAPVQQVQEPSSSPMSECGLEGTQAAVVELVFGQRMPSLASYVSSCDDVCETAEITADEAVQPADRNQAASIPSDGNRNEHAAQHTTANSHAHSNDVDQSQVHHALLKTNMALANALQDAVAAFERANRETDRVLARANSMRYGRVSRKLRGSHRSSVDSRTGFGAGTSKGIGAGTPNVVDAFPVRCETFTPRSAYKQGFHFNDKVVADAPSPTRIQDLARALRADRATEALTCPSSAAANNRKFSDDALSSAGETDVDEPIAEPKAIRLGSRSKSLHHGTTSPMPPPIRDATWPLSNRASLEFAPAPLPEEEEEDWGVSPASIREVESYHLTTASMGGVPIVGVGVGANEPASDSFAFMPERLSSRGRGNWDGYVPETLLNAQLTELGTRSRAAPRPPSRRRRMPWSRTKASADDVERPWDAIRQQHRRPPRPQSKPKRSCDAAYAREEFEPTTVELITAVADIDEDESAKNRRRRSRRRRSTRGETAHNELPKWPREIRRVRSTW